VGVVRFKKDWHASRAITLTKFVRLLWLNRSKENQVDTPIFARDELLKTRLPVDSLDNPDRQVLADGIYFFGP